MKASITFLLILFFTITMSGCGAYSELNTLKNGEKDERCEAALQLAISGNTEAKEIVETFLTDGDPQIRKCGLIARGYYREEPLCQQYYDLWLADSDGEVRKTAGMIFLENECENRVKRSSVYEMDSKTCGYTQFYVNNFRDLIFEQEGGGDWKSSLSSEDIRNTITDADTPDEIISMRLNLVFAAIDWGDSVSLLRGQKDYGSIKENKKRYIELREAYSLKQEFLLQFCPKLMFPEFDYWSGKLVQQ